MEESRTAFVKKETNVIEKIVNVLSKPSKYDISEKEMFTVFNSSSSMLDTIVNGPKLMVESDGSIDGMKSVSTKMIDFQNLVALGQQLADKRDTIKSVSDNNNDDTRVINNAIDVISTVYQTLSTHVYINHVKTPASTAAVCAAAASSSNPEQSWWNKSNNKTLDSKLKDSQNISSSTNPLESHDYFPDLRLVLKNVLILFINFFKRYEELIERRTTLGTSERELIKILRDLMLLLNVSVLNKLVEIFKMLNPNISLNVENDIYGVLAV